MVQDNGKHVIVHISCGSAHVMRCTLANAKRLMESNLENLETEIREIAELLHAPQSQRTAKVIAASKVVAALQELLALEIGASTKHLRTLIHGHKPSAAPDERPEEFVTQQRRDEVVLWAFKHKLDPHKIGESEWKIQAMAPHESLSFMTSVVARAKGLPLRYVQTHVLNGAAELNQLLHGTWKETALEHRIVQSYLSFTIEHLLNNRNSSLEIAEVDAPATKR